MKGYINQVGQLYIERPIEPNKEGVEQTKGVICSCMFSPIINAICGQHCGHFKEPYEAEQDGGGTIVQLEICQQSVLQFEELDDKRRDPAPKEDPDAPLPSEDTPGSMEPTDTRHPAYKDPGAEQPVKKK